MVRIEIDNPVRRARERARLSQVQLAVRARVSLSTLRNAEQGLSTLRTLGALARALGLDVDSLTGRRAAAETNNGATR